MSVLFALTHRIGQLRELRGYKEGYAWKGLLRIATIGSRDATYDHARKIFDRLAMYENESSRDYFI